LVSILLSSLYFCILILLKVCWFWLVLLGVDLGAFCVMAKSCSL